MTQDLPLGWNAFAYTLEGEMNFGVGENKTAVRKYHNVVFDREGDSVTVEVEKDAKEAAQFCMSFPSILSFVIHLLTKCSIVLVAGRPLDQKVVQYGPFVLNSQEEVYQAMMDYQTHSNGFERAKDWQSEIGKSKVH